MVLVWYNTHMTRESEKRKYMDGVAPNWNGSSLSWIMQYVNTETADFSGLAGLAGYPTEAACQAAIDAKCVKLALGLLPKPASEEIARLWAQQQLAYFERVSSQHKKS